MSRLAAFVATVPPNEGRRQTQTHQEPRVHHAVTPESGPLDDPFADVEPAHDENSIVDEDGPAHLGHHVHLHLGTAAGDASHLELLTSRGIGLAVNVLPSEGARSDVREACAAAGVAHHEIVLEDDGEMHAHFGLVADLIAEARCLRPNHPGVLFTCHEGFSHATTLAASFLMHDRGWNLEEVATHMVECRFVVRPSPIFLRALRQLERELISERREDADCDLNEQYRRRTAGGSREQSVGGDSVANGAAAEVGASAMMMMVPISAVRDDRADGDTTGEAGLDEEARENLRWCTKLAAIVEDGRPRQKLPCRILPHVYLGSKFEAMDPAVLRRHGITAVLNMAAGSLQSEYDPDALYAPLKTNAGADGSPPFMYCGIDAEDEPDYELLDAHFDQARKFIDEAGAAGGRVLVHCAAGINRSGAVVVAYTMAHRGMVLLDAVRHVHKRRGPLCTNEGFQRQLVRWARENRKLG